MALRDGFQIDDITLRHHHIGNLLLPSGELVACDPFVSPEAEPFNLKLPRGTFPVVLSVAEIDSDERVAYATVRFAQGAPVTWEILSARKQDVSTLEKSEMWVYGVDSGTGCFMDRVAGRVLEQTMRKQENFFETLIADMEKTYRDTWNWLDMKFGEGNLIAFSSGYGDGIYPTFAGRDGNGEISVVVTEFDVVPNKKFDV